MGTVEAAEAGREPAAFLRLAFDAEDGALPWRRTAIERRCVSVAIPRPAKPTAR